MFCDSITLAHFEPAEVAFLVSILFNDDNHPTLEKPMILAKRTYQKRKVCQISNCHSYVQSKNRCKRHGGGKRCRTPQCNKSSKSNGLCHAHGGGLVCQVFGCSKAAQKRGLCAAHGVKICALSTDASTLLEEIKNPPKWTFWFRSCSTTTMFQPSRAL